MYLFNSQQVVACGCQGEHFRVFYFEPQMLNKNSKVILKNHNSHKHLSIEACPIFLGKQD